VEYAPPLSRGIEEQVSVKAPTFGNQLHLKADTSSLADEGPDPQPRTELPNQHQSKKLELREKLRASKRRVV
jgi:hypothetical protein